MPSVPYGRRITTTLPSDDDDDSNSSSNSNNTVTLEWDLTPTANYYWVTVLPLASNLSNGEYYRERVFFSPWNVTLESNVIYNISISAVNCNGESEPLYIRYGM